VKWEEAKPRLLGSLMEENHPNVDAINLWSCGYQTQLKILRENFGDAEVIGR